MAIIREGEEARWSEEPKWKKIEGERDKRDWSQVIRCLVNMFDQSLYLNTAVWHIFFTNTVSIFFTGHSFFWACVCGPWRNFQLDRLVSRTRDLSASHQRARSQVRGAWGSGAKRIETVWMQLPDRPAVWGPLSICMWTTSTLLVGQATTQEETSIWEIPASGLVPESLGIETGWT